MVESQSRYGIMEELNNRKIKEREKLANIERELDQESWTAEQEIEKMKQNIKDKESSYQHEHRMKTREIETAIRMLELDFKRQKEALENDLHEEESGYENKFQAWKKDKEQSIHDKERNLERFRELHQKKIADKKVVLAEIDAGIKSLKEMSSNQQGEE